MCTLENLQQSKVYQKEQRRQFKELKELVRRHQKKTAELLREFNNKYKKTARQCSKSRCFYIFFQLFSSGCNKYVLRFTFFQSVAVFLPCMLVLTRGSCSEGKKDDHLQQLRDEQQQQLLALRQEQYYSQKYLQREHIKTVQPTILN